MSFSVASGHHMYRWRKEVAMTFVQQTREKNVDLCGNVVYVACEIHFD